MSSASKVGEIFTAAGTAFTKLGELTMQLHSSNKGGGGTKWTEEDIALMHNCLTKFANEIDEISSRVRLRTMTHINSGVKKREYDESPNSSMNSNVLSAASTPPSIHRGGGRKAARKLAATATAVSSSTSTPTSHLSPVSPPPHSEEVTLDMFNTSEEQDDSYLKIDFDSSGSS